MKKYRLSSEAVLDIEDGIIYYNGEVEGLGIGFFDEFKKTLNLIRSFPEIGVFHLQQIRKLSMHRFRHVIYYLYENDTIHVISVIHETRGLKYHSGRLKGLSG